MFISVQFGYSQSMVFNINCQVAPLLDAIHSQAYSEMVKAIGKRQEWFQKEVAGMRKKEAKLLKQLDQLDAPKREAARLAAEAEATASRENLKKSTKRMTAKERKAEEERLKKEEEERKAREEEEARLKAEEEERKRKEEEEKKAAAAKDKKGKGKKGKDEEVEEPVEETEEVKIER